MPVAGFDHVALPTADADRFIDFYKKLGFSIIDEDEWRRGEARIFAIQIGNSKINVHPQGMIANLRGVTASPGCGDLCFVWDGAVDEVVKMLSDAGVEVIQGPAPRKGGRDAGQRFGTSVYVRDPDDNLLEFMVYE